MNHKRKKPRRKVKCAMCTPHRNGNTRSRYYATKATKAADLNAKEQTR